MTPAWSISADGVDITSRFNDRLLELTVTDNEGLKSDSCEILVDDRDGQLAIPRKGAILAISMGYRETGLTFMGLYTVDEVEVSGFPRQMRISASAADLREKLKEQRSKGYDKKKIGDIVGEIAKRHNLKPAVSSALKDFEYEHLAQSEESDLHLLSRLARKHDALAKVANGQLLFVKRGDAQSASGRPMSQAIIHGSQVLEYSASFQDKPLHEKAQSQWWDKKKARRRTTEAKPGNTTGGQGWGPIVREVYGLE